MPERCRHCGSTFEPEPGNGGFCSPGCAAVHARIVAGGYGRFYDLKDRAVAPVGGAALLPRDTLWIETAAREAEARGSGTSELVVEVQGISCVGCVWLIERLFRRRPGAVRIDINATHGRLLWRWETGRFDAPGFARELRDFGYLVGPVGTGVAAPEGQSLRLRLGLCAAFAMNTMLFVLPSYLGLERTSEFHPLFEALAAAFATAALIAGGGFFFKRAAAGIRAGVMTIDVPISLGLLIGHAGSLAGWVAGHPGLVYFDFVAVFSFLMLVGRWTQEVAVERNRSQLLALNRDPAQVMVETGGGGAAGGGAFLAPVASLDKGRVFQVRSGQVVPVASRLLSPSGTFTTEWINGEPEPRELRAGQLAPSGASNVGLEPVRLEAVEDWADSALARLLDASGARGFRHGRAEAVIRWYLYAIVAIALAGGAGWWWIAGDALKALHVTMAVLVASCPCGIGVAFPLIEELAVAAMRRSGVFVRELSLFPRILRVRKVVFDKTGTLTLETPALSNRESLEGLTGLERSRLGALVRENPHPAARAVHEALAFLDADRGDAAGPKEATGATAHVEEVVGQGVRLRAEDGIWSLGRADFASAGDGGSDAVFARDGRTLARFHFAEAVRAGARAEIAALQAEGRDVFILSGDRAEKVGALAESLGIGPGRAHGGLTPEQKRDWVRRNDESDTLMLGDGANDSLAFDAAFARGTPVIHRGALERRSDFFYLGRGVGGIRRLFAVADLRRRSLRRVFAFAVLYNAGTVAAALAGWVNPLVAAVLMPASSLLNLALAMTGMRRAFRD